MYYVCITINVYMHLFFRRMDRHNNTVFAGTCILGTSLSTSSNMDPLEKCCRLDLSNYVSIFNARTMQLGFYIKFTDKNFDRNLLQYFFKPFIHLQ